MSARATKNILRVVSDSNLPRGVCLWAFSCFVYGLDFDDFVFGFFATGDFDAGFCNIKMLGQGLYYGFVCLAVVGFGVGADDYFAVFLGDFFNFGSRFDSNRVFHWLYYSIF